MNGLALGRPKPTWVSRGEVYKVTLTTFNTSFPVFLPVHYMASSQPFTAIPQSDVHKGKLTETPLVAVAKAVDTAGVA